MQIISNSCFQSKKELFVFASNILQTINQESDNLSNLVKLRVELENGLRDVNFTLTPSEEASLVVVRHNLSAQIEKGSIKKISSFKWKTVSS